jgi:hypothetical protein
MVVAGICLFVFAGYRFIKSRKGGGGGNGGGTKELIWELLGVALLIWPDVMVGTVFCGFLDGVGTFFTAIGGKLFNSSP